MMRIFKVRLRPGVRGFTTGHGAFATASKQKGAAGMALSYSCHDPTPLYTRHCGYLSHAYRTLVTRCPPVSSTTAPWPLAPSRARRGTPPCATGIASVVTDGLSPQHFPVPVSSHPPSPPRGSVPGLRRRSSTVVTARCRARPRPPAKGHGDRRCGARSARGGATRPGTVAKEDGRHREAPADPLLSPRVRVLRGAGSRVDAVARSRGEFQRCHLRVANLGPVVELVPGELHEREGHARVADLGARPDERGKHAWLGGSAKFASPWYQAMPAKRMFRRG